jgi:hypothetical protein
MKNDKKSMNTILLNFVDNFIELIENLVGHSLSE